MSILPAIILSLLPLAPPKKLVFENKTYEPEIKTVQLYSRKQEFRSSLLPAATAINQPDLVLEFDDLREDIQHYYATVIHCNYDWTSSAMRDLDYMQDYNEFNVNDYAYSSNTDIYYVHYRFELPRVKLPGNYLLVVYRDGNKNDMILSHRFMVYDNRVSLVEDRQASGSLNLQANNQQLNFVVNYKGLEIVNPFESVHVVIRQNQRWDVARFNIRPSFVREDRSEIEYRLFDDDKFFTAGNEFRFVDFRSVNFPGINTDRIDKSTRPYHLWLQRDSRRSEQVYSLYQDINGQYYIENLDQGDPQTASQYVWVTFSLQADEIPDAGIFVVGAFNQWQKNDKSKLNYDPSTGLYSNTSLMKQGWYNYQYWVEHDKLTPQYFEGSHFQTENLYEIFFYYRPFQPNADLLLGYFPISVNPR